MSAHFESSHYGASHYESSHYGRGLVITITPKGGITDALLRLRKRNRKARRNVVNLLNLVTIFIVIEEGDDD